jgi:hypothetical protein
MQCGAQYRFAGPVPKFDIWMPDQQRSIACRTASGMTIPVSNL